MFTSSVNFSLLLLSLATLTMTLPILEKQQLSDAELPHRDVVLRETPGDPQPRLKPYVLSLFESFEANAKEQPDQHRYNTLRSFEITQAKGCKDSKYTFIFNMSSIPKEEDISKAIFRVYINVSTSFSSSQGSAELTLTSNDSKIYTKVITPNESHFVDFPVQQHINNWLKNGQLKYLVNLGVKIDLADEPLECGNKDMGIVYDDADDSTQPTLVVYSYDHNEDRLMEKLNKAISEKINGSEINRSGRATRSTGKSVSKTDSGECRKSGLSIDKGQLAQILDIEIDYPLSFELSVCGGHCPGSKYINQFHSKITYLLLATPDVEHLANKHQYSKSCVPTSYHSINYIKLGQNGSVIKTLDHFTVAECSCVYSYLD